VPSVPGAPGAAATPAQCQQAIDYKVLVAALPNNTAGYVMTEPQGTTLSWADPTNASNVVQYSSASGSYTNGDKGIDVSIMDTCYVQFLAGAWMGFVQYDSTQGWLKQATLAGYPAWEQYDKSSDQYSDFVIVNQRVYVSVDGRNGASESDVDAIANAIDYGTIVGAMG
jgi:hypothetical protein